MVDRAGPGKEPVLMDSLLSGKSWKTTNSNHKIVSGRGGAWYPEDMKRISISAGLLCITAAHCPAQQKVDAFGKVFYHNNGQRTTTQKMGNSNEIREETYDKNNVLSAVRIFQVDTKGRLLNGVIYDGRKNPVGSTRYSFDPQTDQPVEEQLFNKEGKLVRRLFYPGALKDARYAKRTVAFSFDPTKPTDPGKVVEGKVKPIVPVTQNEDEFEPGLPTGTAAPTPAEFQERRNGTPPSSATPKPLPPRSWMPQKKR